MIRWLWDKMLKWGWDFNRGLRGLSPEVMQDRKLQASPEVRIAKMRLLKNITSVVMKMV
jgi:hypothetical protein